MKSSALAKAAEAMERTAAIGGNPQHGYLADSLHLRLRQAGAAPAGSGMVGGRRKRVAPARALRRGRRHGEGRPDPRVVQALEKLIRGDMSVQEMRRRIALIKPPTTPNPRPADNAPVNPAPHVVEALERLMDGEKSPVEAKRLTEKATP